MSVASVAPDPQSAYRPGVVVSGKYELESLLGEGGMGSVWCARNTALDAPVAIKLLRADLNRDLLGGRLLQEARAAARLNHPAIVRVFDVGQTEPGDPFIVMELLQGQSLAALLAAEGRQPATRVVQLLLPIADALCLAHSKGIIHRDLKPDNVFLTEAGGQLQPKLVDFGIVKVEQKEGTDQLTQHGAVLGSPDYMSPEQARGQDDLDARTDVWSFSVMLFEMLTGETPFSAPNYNALLRAIVEEPAPSLRDFGAGDPQLGEIVARGLEKTRDARWPSMQVLGRALAGWLLEQGPTEDICGSSLEAKWLLRSNNPEARAASRSSIPDSWPEPFTGVRRAGTLGNAPTIEVGQGRAKARPNAPLLKVSALALGGTVLFALVIWAATRPSDNEPSPGPAAPAAQPVSAETTLVGPRTKEPAVHVPPTPSTPAASNGTAKGLPLGAAASRPRPASTPVSAHTKLPPTPADSAAPADRTSPAATKPAPQTDLIAPY